MSGQKHEFLNPLTEAVRARDMWSANRALHRGFHPDAEDAVDDYGSSPLQLSIAADADAGLIGLLLLAGANANGNPHSEGTPLETAAFYGECDAIFNLVRAGARITFQGFEGTPMEVAEREGHREAVLMLCALGAPKAEWPAHVSEEDVADFVASWERHHGDLGVLPSLVA